MNRKTFGAILCLALTALLGAAEQNILKNGDFKAVAKNNVPTSWRLDGKNAAVTDNNGVKEFQAMPIFRHNSYFASLGQSLDLTAGKYKFSGEVKGKMTHLNLVVYCGNLKPKTTLRRVSFTGEMKDWKTFSTEFTLSGDQKRAGLTAVFYVPGEKDPVFIRNLKLQKIDKEQTKK